MEVWHWDSGLSIATVTHAAFEEAIGRLEFVVGNENLKFLMKIARVMSLNLPDDAILIIRVPSPPPTLPLPIDIARRRKFVISS